VLLYADSHTDLVQALRELLRLFISNTSKRQDHRLYKECMITKHMLGRLPHKCLDLRHNIPVGIILQVYKLIFSTAIVFKTRKYLVKQVHHRKKFMLLCPLHYSMEQNHSNWCADHKDDLNYNLKTKLWLGRMLNVWLSQKWMCLHIIPPAPENITDS